MTSIQQALHSKGSEQSVVPVPLRQAASHPRATGGSKPSTGATGNSVTCPGCDTIRQLQHSTREAWTKKIRALFGLPAHRCRACHRRFSDEDANETQLVERHRVNVLSTFLRPDDDRGFSDLVGKIAQAERDQTVQGPAPSKNDQTIERRHAERWLSDSRSE
jgi:hypothetical protein